MGNCQSGYHTNCAQGRPKNVIAGNSVDIKLTECDAAEVRADVLVQSAEQGQDGCNVVRLWGQVKDCNNKPVPNALIKLLKVICNANGTQYQGIAHTVSDCEGFYQFDLCYCTGQECYKILVSKAYTGPEQIIDTASNGGNCGACMGNGNGYNPCKTYSPIVTPGGDMGKCCSNPQPCPPQPYQPQPYQPQPCQPQPCQPQPNQPQPCGCNKQYPYHASMCMTNSCGC